MSPRSSQDHLLRQIARLPEQETFVAQFVSLQGTRARVIHGTSVIDVRSISQYPLIPGDAVRIRRTGADVVLTGPSTPKSATGRVTATGSPRCTVEYPSGSGVTSQMPYNVAYSPAVNDVVLVSWNADGPVVECKLTALPELPAPSTPSTPASPTVHLPPITARDSGSYNSRWWTGDVRASVGNIGAWFYGTKIKDSIPDSAEILKARIYLPAKQVYGNRPNLGYHTQGAKPAGTVAISSAAALDASSGWVKIPTSIIDALKATTGGIGFDGGGFNIYAGVASDGMSGALDITFRS